MDVKVYQCVIQNVFTVYYTVLTESNSTEKITIPYVDYGRFEVFAEPGFSFEIVQDEVKSIYDRNESFENCLGWVPKRNIKGEGEILEYIKELEGDTSWRSWCSDWANKFKNIKDITITQEDINDYISEAKNRYKIYR